MKPGRNVWRSISHWPYSRARRLVSVMAITIGPSGGSSSLSTTPMKADYTTVDPKVAGYVKVVLVNDETVKAVMIETSTMEELLLRTERLKIDLPQSLRGLMDCVRNRPPVNAGTAVEGLLCAHVANDYNCNIGAKRQKLASSAWGGF